MIYIWWVWKAIYESRIGSNKNKIKKNLVIEKYSRYYEEYSSYNEKLPRYYEKYSSYY